MRIAFTLNKSSPLSSAEIADRFKTKGYEVELGERGVVSIRTKPIPKILFSSGQINTFDEFSIERAGSSFRVSLHFYWVFFLILFGMTGLIVVNEFFLKQYSTRPSPDILTSLLSLFGGLVIVLAKSIYDVRKEVKKVLQL